MHEGELLAALLGELERVSHDPLDPVRGVDAQLVGDLVRGADPESPAVADVRALGALADDHEIHIARMRERTRHAGEDPRRPQVDVVVEREAQLEQQPAFDDAAREFRVAGVAADRAQHDRVVRRERREVVVAQDLA